MEPSGLTMCCVKAVRMACHSAYTPAGEYTIVDTVKMLVWFVLVSSLSPIAVEPILQKSI